MIFHYKQLTKWFLHPVALTLIVATAIACQPQSPSVVSSSSESPAQSSTLQPISQKQAIYESDRFNFQFSYSPNDFVVDDKAKIPSSKDTPAAIQIWTQEHAKKIRSGAYEGGTEYPANVSVTISKNPKKLSLPNWVKQSNQFGATREFTNTKVAGRNAIAFQSSGLYENEHVVFSSPKGSDIIIISVAKTGYGNNDAIYQKAFAQVVKSFAFVRG